MMIATDSSAIDNALLALLGADTALLALMPNGVYYDLAPLGSTRYVTVAIDQSVDVATFDGRAQEDLHYAVTAVGLSTAHPDVGAAALRIDQLLEDQPLVIDAYTWATTYRVRRIRETRADVTNPSIRWMSRGGVYRVVVAPIPPADYPTTIRRDKPLVYARCEDPVGATVLLDSSGHGRTSLPVPASTHPGGLNGVVGSLCLVQDPVVAAGATGSPPWPDDPAYAPIDFSAEIWIYNKLGGYGWMCGQGSVVNIPRWSIAEDPTTLAFNAGYRIDQWSWGSVRVTTPRPPDDTWTHLVLTATKQTLTAYVNGQVIGTAVSSYPFVDVSGGPWMGGQAGQAQANPLDEFAVYDYALTAAQVAEHYAAAMRSTTRRSRS